MKFTSNEKAFYCLLIAGILLVAFWPYGIPFTLIFVVTAVHFYFQIR